MYLILNKITLFVVAGIIIILTLAFNEIARLPERVRHSRVVSQSWLVDATDGLYKAQALCQEETGFICDYQKCDPTRPGTPDGFCSKARVGWRATDVAVPDFYRYLTSIQLIISQKPLLTRYEILPRKNTITRRIEPGIGDILSDTKRLATVGATPVTNKIIQLDIFRDAETSLVNASSTAPTYHLMLTADIPVAGLAATSTEQQMEKLSCSEEACSHAIMGIKSDIELLWFKSNL